MFLQSNPTLNPDRICLAQVVKIADIFFCIERHKKRLPFFHGFPKNCCEISAALLGKALHDISPDANVVIAKAYNCRRGDWHFWVEVGNQVIDVTAHQFDGYLGPIVCLAPNPLEVNFPEVERITPTQALENFGCEFDVLVVVLNEIKAEINSHQ